MDLWIKRVFRENTYQVAIGIVVDSQYLSYIVHKEKFFVYQLLINILEVRIV